MALHLEPVGGVKVRLAGSWAARDRGPSAGQLVAYVLSAIGGALVGAQVTGPLVARFVFGG